MVGEAIGAGFQAIGNVASAINSRNQQKIVEKQGFQDTSSRLIQLRQQREVIKEAETRERAKNQRVLIISIVAFVSIIVIALVLYFINKK